MTDYAQINPGKHHLGYRFSSEERTEPLPMDGEDKNRIELKYKHAVIINRTFYAGNVQVFNRRNGSINVESDAIYKSMPNQFDVFTNYNKIEAAVNDGEEITALSDYGDKILQFKSKTLYIINVSRQVEILEDTHNFKGATSQASVCKTDYGVAWANDNGCYLYNGKTVIDLLEKEGIQLISQSHWSSVIVDPPLVGYNPKKRQLIVVDNIKADAYGEGFIYDMVTKSWVQCGRARFNDAVKTNFVTDWDNNLVYATSSTPLKWVDASANTTRYEFITGDIDFGQPSVRKKVYKVYLTFRGNANHVQVNYGVDGDTTPTETFYAIASGTNGSSTKAGAAHKCIAYDAGVTDWLRAELIPSDNDKVKSLKSFRLKISADASNAIDSTFEINDISIIYRMKSVK